MVSRTIVSVSSYLRSNGCRVIQADSVSLSTDMGSLKSTPQQT